jgi:hypothetical protein
MAELRYKHVGILPFAGVSNGTIIKVDDEQVDTYGRVRVVDPSEGEHWVNLQGAVLGGILEPQSKDATALASTPVPLATTVPVTAPVEGERG